MPSNPRQAIKAKLDSAIVHCEKIQETLAFLGEVVYTDYPEIVEQYKVTFAFFEQGLALLDGLRRTY